MTDVREVDVSADAVAVRVARLYSLEERGWIDTGVSDFIIALSAARDEAVREERERCAKIADANADAAAEQEYPDLENQALAIAAAIRRGAKS